VNDTAYGPSCHDIRDEPLAVERKQRNWGKSRWWGGGRGGGARENRRIKVKPSFELEKSKTLRARDTV